MGEDTFIADVILTPHVCKTINEFMPKKTHLFTSTICKEWTKSDTVYTSIREMSMSESMIEECAHIFTASGRLSRLMMASVIHGTIGCMEKVYDSFQRRYGGGVFFPWQRGTFYKAVHLGTSIEKMEYMRDRGCPFFHKALDMAVMNGSLKNVIWLFENKCKFSCSTFDKASKQGSLDIMTWILSKGCEFGKYTFSEAAANGNLQNMIWLKSVGCKFDKRTYLEADRNGSDENKDWLELHKCRKYTSLADNIGFDIEDFIRENSSEFSYY